MYISCAVVPVHLATNHLLIYTTGLGYMGAAYATSLSSLLSLLLTLIYVAGAGRWGALVGVAVGPTESQDSDGDPSATIESVFNINFVGKLFER